MKFTIKHEIPGRIRIHMEQKQMSYKEADTLLYYLDTLEYVTQAKVYRRTADACVCFSGKRELLIQALRKFRYTSVKVPDEVLTNSGRQLNDIYQEKLIGKVLFHYAGKIFLPYPVRKAVVLWKAVHYLKEGWKSLARRKLEVAVLDASAIGISVLRGDFNTAASVMFLLGVGETLEEWTHKKSVGDLARSMSLNVSKVWLKSEEQEVLVDSRKIKEGDNIVVHMGNVIPFDGVVCEGEGMVNQSSLTGEPLPVLKKAGGYVYAGSVLEEGELTFTVKKAGGSSRYEKIVEMIEESEKLKSSLEGKAERLADRLVPVTFAGTALTWLFTRNITKALAVLMVDFSCALKLTMPIAVLSAIRQAGSYDITVKGGKFLEAVAEAETIVLDKTGTLTKAMPTVKMIVPFCEAGENELLRIAACLEEHFPHSMAKAVVSAAKKAGLEHEEMHSKVEYIVAHGISSSIEGKRVFIGSAHFIFDDEKCTVPKEYQKQFESLPEEYSHLYLAIDGVLAAVICIEDPLREESASVVRALKEAGFQKVVMMTGDNERTAAFIARKAGVDEYYSEVLPEDKAMFIEKEKSKGKKVLMVGDGINDSPALSAADAGIAVSDGSELAREIADITIPADNLYQIVRLKYLSQALMRRINRNYKEIVGINTLLILLGVGGMIQPTTTAMFHNMSTIAISLQSMQNLSEIEEV
ncbi:MULTISPECIES: heavy metal translocating P-type ATPase [Clostridia]|uniref:heavy metal translocating P-type ATPase n=1 Tax=Clostridia TaxID=186801 RepID=UPI00082D90EB|nr:heavy metal translocating P-type ATPase [Clostridium sp. AT4]